MSSYPVVEVAVADVVIRPMLECETAAIRVLMERTFEVYLRPIFYIHPESTLVAVAGEQILGGINLDIYPLRRGKLWMGYMGWLYISEEARGLGLGRKLVAAALDFLQAAGCTDVAACVEGDNPSSFKQLAYQGFAPLSLYGQIKRFGIGLPKVWKHASRFFDFGYFLWHKNLFGISAEAPPTASQKSTLLEPSPREQLKSLTTTGLFALAMWMVLILRNQLLPLLNDHTVSLPVRLLWLFFPLLAIGIRTLAMWMIARTLGLPVVYTAWDTANVLGFLFPLVLGWPFPIPGNYYRRGTDWQLAKDAKSLGIIALGTTLVEISLLAALKISFTVLLPTRAGGGQTHSFAKFPVLFLSMLCLCDTLLFFYPFCGFNASRIKRLSPYLAAVTCALLLAVIVFL